MTFTGHNNSKGFTLVELLIVIAIMGTLIGIAAFSVSELRARYGVEKTIKDLYTDLMNVRVLAMSRNTPHFVVFAASQYTIYEDTSPAPNGNGLLEAGSDRLVDTKKADPGYTLAYTAGMTGAETFQFTGKGLVPENVISKGTNGNITVSVTTTAAAEYDCLLISQIKLTLGKMNGTNCVAK